MESHKKLEIGSTVQQVWSGNKYNVLALETGVIDYAGYIKEIPSDTHYKAELIEVGHRPINGRYADKVNQIIYLTYEGLDKGWTVIL